MPRVEDAPGSISEVDVVGSVQWRGRVRGESSGGGFGGAFRQCHNAHWDMARERVWTNLAIGQHALRRGSPSDARLVVASQRGGLASKQATGACSAGCCVLVGVGVVLGGPSPTDSAVIRSALRKKLSPAKLFFLFCLGSPPPPAPEPALACHKLLPERASTWATAAI